MIIDTLTSNLYLFKTHKWRYHYQNGLDKRRAFCLTCAIVFCVTVAVMIYVIYG